MASIARRAAALTLACSTFAGLTALSSTTASAAGTPAFPPLNAAALRAAIQTRPGDDAAGDVVRVGEPGREPAEPAADRGGADAYSLR